jgi:hypothetical protein
MADCTTITTSPHGWGGRRACTPKPRRLRVQAPKPQQTRLPRYVKLHALPLSSFIPSLLPTCSPRTACEHLCRAHALSTSRNCEHRAKRFPKYPPYKLRISRGDFFDISDLIPRLLRTRTRQQTELGSAWTVENRQTLTLGLLTPYRHPPNTRRRKLEFSRLVRARPCFCITVRLVG